MKHVLCMCVCVFGKIMHACVMNACMQASVGGFLYVWFHERMYAAAKPSICDRELGT